MLCRNFRLSKNKLWLEYCVRSTEKQSLQLKQTFYVQKQVQLGNKLKQNLPIIFKNTRSFFPENLILVFFVSTISSRKQNYFSQPYFPEPSSSGAICLETLKLSPTYISLGTLSIFTSRTNFPFIGRHKLAIIFMFYFISNSPIINGFCIQRGKYQLERKFYVIPLPHLFNCLLFCYSCIFI